MAAIYETTMCLRFFGDELDPDEITACLGRPPSVGMRKGGTWVTELGAEKVARTGSWRLKTNDRQPRDFDSHIAQILEGLSDDLAVWEDLVTRFKADVFCGLFMKESNEGLSLSAKSMLDLGARGLSLEFDIYDSGLPD
ncbi:DUF4279 domain-containing protein [Sphingomonas sp. QA11]|uniref:DUF4279 domain-containing protein n=1 Tax=Sphingomonas sp. QA11 TaxID=2950605 RepID=UPI00234BAD1D|nr:DUF4279 domain-containing protein [Sphingomonas sp. QA11]WCM26911.1 DUF4279 domain-containing protein [Sphingomonas sp. QA11]